MKRTAAIAAPAPATPRWRARPPRPARQAEPPIAINLTYAEADDPEARAKVVKLLADLLAGRLG